MLVSPTLASVIESPSVRTRAATPTTAQAWATRLNFSYALPQPGEVLVEVRVPVLGPGWGSAYEKFNRVAQAWAVVGVAALVRTEGDMIGEARIGLTNMGPTPLRARGAEQALAGVSSQNGGITRAAELAADDTEPPADLSAQPDYRQHLARVLTGRAVHKAVAAS